MTKLLCSRMRMRTKVTLAVGAGVTALVAGAMPALADSPRVNVFTSGINRCAANWYSGANQFGIADTSVDNRYCYVVYNWTNDLDGSAYRINKGIDSGVPNATRYTISVSGHSVIWWKLCREVPSDPDNCSSARSDAT